MCWSENVPLMILYLHKTVIHFSYKLQLVQYLRNCLKCEILWTELLNLARRVTDWLAARNIVTAIDSARSYGYVCLPPHHAHTILFYLYLFHRTRLFKCCKSTETVIQKIPTLNPTALLPIDTQSVEVVKPSAPPASDDSVTVASVPSDDMKTSSFDNECINIFKLKQEEEPKLMVKQSYFPMKANNLTFFGSKRSVAPNSTIITAGAEEDKAVKTPYNCWGFNDRNNEPSNNSSKYCGMFS